MACRSELTWLYTILAGSSVRVRYDLRQHEADWQTVEPYTEPPLTTPIPPHIAAKLAQRQTSIDKTCAKWIRKSVAQEQRRLRARAVDCG